MIDAYDVNQSLLRIIDRLDSLIDLLESMKQQEYDYWETWRRIKEKENDNKR